MRYQLTYTFMEMLLAEQLNYGYRYAFLASFIFALIGFVLSFWLKSKQQ